MSTKLQIKCPRCDTRVEAVVKIHEGEAPIPYYRDGSGYPGSAPFVEAIEDIRYECTCAFVAGWQEQCAYEDEVEALILRAGAEPD